VVLLLLLMQVTAEGYESDLQQLLTWLHTGSPQADVSGVEVTWGSATGEFDEFDTLWTA
jgi:acylphosphatase